ncbi:hypothetical protein SAY86_004081 [Trapa natans]|uniref:DEK-C domain-containing protein n=1 Tax=Trapa natans TaxID=22666 RepID=A0AAN7MF27_TRANT|nr:hypothetical protein SAY86_004081 [Trapa natans]
MDPEIQQKIETVVRQVLEESDLDQMTEFKVRQEASNRLKMSLSQPNYKAFVRQVVEAFLQEQKAKENQQAVEEEEEEEKNDGDEDEDEGEGGGRGRRSDGEKKFTDDGDLIICQLGAKRKVTIQEFRGKSLVSIREYYNQGTKEMPSSKGISLTEEQWAVFRKNLPAIQAAIKKMESHLQ